LSTYRIFDHKHYESLNSSRGAVVSSLLAELQAPLGLKTAIDIGCGLGYFSELLRALGFDVTAVDGRTENTKEAARRYPGIKFHTYNAEDPSLTALGKFDLVFCFGLLYHLENPFRVIRNLYAMTNRLLLVEGVIYPGDSALMGLVDETPFDDQGLNHVAFYPTEACMAKMFYRSGFCNVYRLSPMADHSDYRSATGLPRVRTMLAAAPAHLSSQLLTVIPEPISSFQPWDATSVAAHVRVSRIWRGFWLWRARISAIRQKFLEITFPIRDRLGVRRATPIKRTSKNDTSE